MRTARLTAVLVMGPSLAWAQPPEITIDDVVAVKYVGAPTWSPDGRSLAFTWDDRGQTDLWAVSVENAELWRVTDSKSVPTAVCWSQDGEALRFVEDGVVWKARRGAEPRAQLRVGPRLRSVTWSPDGEAFVFGRGDVLWYRAPWGEERVMPAADTTGRRPQFSPDGARIAVADRGRGGAQQVVDVETGDVAWRSASSALQFVGWMSAKRLLARRGTHYVAVDIEGGGDDGAALREVWEENDGGRSPVLSPAGDRLLLTRQNEQGWPHLFVISLADRGIWVLTQGAHEVSDAAWSPDGKSVVYASNAGSSGERHLYRVPAGGGDAVKLTEALPGTNIQPRWSADGSTLAFTHCGPYRASDLWLLPVDGEARQLTFSMPEAFDENSVTVPREVIYKGVGDLDIHAWLFEPKGLDRSVKHPAIVWLHGGPIRQMRYGWHPRRSYSIFYSYHQRLVQQGYVVLSINFRGGIGYGRAFRDALHLKMGVDDVLDVVKGADHLKSLAYVDSERVGVWGISYGGYLTLQALGVHPGAFSMGVNVAGVFDWATQVEIYNSRGRFVRFMGGTPEESPEPYRVGSPATYVQNIDVPLLNLHGTADRNVPFSQLDELVGAMVKHNLQFEVMYYPGQPHVFRDGDVWRHAFTKIEAFFDTHL